MYYMTYNVYACISLNYTLLYMVTMCTSNQANDVHCYFCSNMLPTKKTALLCCVRIMNGLNAGITSHWLLQQYPG